MKKPRCVCCGKSFQSRPQVPNQSCCAAPEYQRERRRHWRQGKLITDPDFRDNQSRAQRAWMIRNPEYWREYRAAHPEYVERNRNRQRTNVPLVHVPPLAKMEVSMCLIPLPAGVYRLRPISAPDLAKIDAWTVEITFLSKTCERLDGVCKEMM